MRHERRSPKARSYRISSQQRAVEPQVHSSNITQLHLMQLHLKPQFPTNAQEVRLKYKVNPSSQHPQVNLKVMFSFMKNAI